MTTRLEDRAYSLLGLFNVNLPLLYGEGEKAFIRLQEEVCGIQTINLSLHGNIRLTICRQVCWPGHQIGS